jgi:hypothetical protein
LGATIYVTPEEIKNLKINEKIFVDGNYYRINKITDVSLTNETLAKVQLIKLTREYEGHRVRYYDLINCTGGTDLHTSTDHNFSIYYLKDYRVNIDGICYTVTAGNYNSGYTYQFVDISDAYTDCDCSISIDDVGIEPYDELQPPPTPSPTPTSICGDCIYYEWENENPYFVSVTYRDCDTQILTTDSVGAGQIYTACTCSAYGYRTSGGSLRVNFTEPCYPSTPTPTPSQTPTVTPTVSITPTRTTTPQPTPTNTKTPTVTPTPSPSFVPAPNSYEVINCDDPGDVRCVGSTNFIPVGKVVKLQGIVDLCFEVVGPCETTQVGQVDTEHVSCESCPR